MKTQALVKTSIIAALFAGVFCWSAAAGDASQLWNMNCAACHGKDGKGHTMMGHKLQIRNLTDPKVQESFTDAQAVKDIKDGITKDDRHIMKAFGNKLNGEQIKDLVAHVRSLKSAK